MMINLVIGHETFRSGSVKILTFARLASNDRWSPISDLVRDRLRMDRYHVSVNSHENVPSSVLNTEHGFWDTYRLEVPNFSMFIIQIVRTNSGSIFTDTTNILIGCHEQASLARIRIPLTGDGRAAMSQAYVEGRIMVVPPVSDFLGATDAPVRGVFNDLGSVDYEVLEPGNQDIIINHLLEVPVTHQITEDQERPVSQPVSRSTTESVVTRMGRRRIIRMKPRGSK